MADIRKDEAPQQVANVACLPGIVGYSMAMPDIHWGYGFAIGGVAALRSGRRSDFPRRRRLRYQLRRAADEYEIGPGANRAAPGKSRRRSLSQYPLGRRFLGRIKLKPKEFHQVLTRGAQWAVQQGYGDAGDLEHIEESGAMAGADPGGITVKAFERGRDQLGTLGSGNHFVEIGFVDEIYDEEAAKAFGLFLGGITITIHTGSRGFGHQVCEDYLKTFQKKAPAFGIDLPDRQLCCAPIRSREGQDYLKAMACAVNYAFANRQIIGEWVRRSFLETLICSPRELGMRVVYEVAHNIAKIETHRVGKKEKKVCVHRKGATRAFPSGHPEIPADYRAIGQPVLIPGDMGRYSFVLAGQAAAMEQTFGSTCHGAGRLLSRHQAQKQVDTRRVLDDMARQGIVLMARGRRTIAEEVPEAYKDVSLVVDTVHRAGLSRKVARLRPMGVIKG
jgi:tRNA-splicing ligase RtcB